MEKSESLWTSERSFIFASIGAAVGLGNIWRFPYMMGKNGGALFLFIYLFFIFFLCLIPLIAEISFGKFTKLRSVEAFASIHPKLKVFGWLGALAAMFVASFYFVLGGWILNYIIEGHNLFKISNYDAYFGSFTSSYSPLLYAVIFTLIAGHFVSRGVKKGIELVNDIMLPTFALLLVFLAIHSLTLPNASLGLEFMFKFDASKLNGSMLLDAFGQALFSLSVGTTNMLIYGSYMGKKDKVSKCSYTIAFFDTLFAVLSGIMIFPAVFSFGLSPESGPKLAFITLPHIFSQMNFGMIIYYAFFVLLFFAAMTSAVAIVEVVSSIVIDQFKISRIKAVALITMIIAVTASLSSVSSSTFNFFDYGASNVLMPLNTLIMCICVGWFAGIPEDYVFNNVVVKTVYNFVLKYIVPIAILINWGSSLLA